MILAALLRGVSLPMRMRMLLLTPYALVDDDILQEEKQRGVSLGGVK